MARNGIGLPESVVFSPQPSQKLYPYRTGMGMFQSAEWTVFFDDFITNSAAGTNIPTGWTGASIDTGATVAVNTTAAIGANGVITLADATASEGATLYGSKNIQLTSGKRFFMECRLRTDDVTDNSVQFGISALTAVTNPEDIFTTTSADLVTFGILDGGAGAVTMLADKSNSGSTAETGTRSLSANTWYTLGIEYDGGSALRGYVDGLLALTWAQAAATIPTGVALAPFVGHINGDGAGAAVVVVDYIRYVCQR
jgi:hypothetical protein